MIKKMQLTSQQKEFFDINGYLIFDNYFSRVELNDFGDSLRKLVQSSLRKVSKFHPKIKPNDFTGKEFDEGIMKLEEIDHVHVANIYDTIAQVPAFLRIVAKPETTECVNQLLNRDPKESLYTFTCRCRIDPSYDERRTTNWHQEVFYSIPKSEFLQTWAPLIRDTTIQNGTIEICPGSHKEGIAKQSRDDTKGIANPFILDSEVVKRYSIKKIEMKLGQFMIFNSRLFHRSGSNVSGKIRYSLVGMYHNVDNENFVPPNITFEYKGINPKQYFEEVFK